MSLKFEPAILHHQVENCTADLFAWLGFDQTSKTVASHGALTGPIGKLHSA